MQTVYRIKVIWKWLFFLSAVGIAVLTYLYSNSLIKELKKEELKKVENWVHVYKKYTSLGDEGGNVNDVDLKFLSPIVQSNTTIPIILYKKSVDEVVLETNVESDGSQEELKVIMQEMALDYDPIVIKGIIKGVHKPELDILVYYTNSTLIPKLKIFPIILIFTFLFFIALAYWAFSESRKSEQSLVWAGMARETAHQIGTPLSSLLGWYELLKLYDVPEDNLVEIQKDLNRLQVITERFSKIGAQPGLDKENVIPIVRNAYQYLRKRASQKIEFDFTCETDEIMVNANKELMSWVIENLMRNAVDSISGPGKISLHLFKQKNKVYIDISDTGKGIKPSHFKTIFEPGFTTKTRGWGLGLSLVKRIIKNYHHGDIYVLKSEINVGTTFRVILQESN